MNIYIIQPLYSYQFYKGKIYERPVLDDITKGLISTYQKNPTETNKQALLNQIGINYDKVLAKKKAKLAELKQTAKDQSKVTEM